MGRVARQQDLKKKKKGIQEPDQGSRGVCTSK